MKKVEAIIRPEKLDEVCQALQKAGYPGIMITEIEGHGLQKGIKQQWRGEEFQVDFLPKIKVEIVIDDEELDNITAAISNSAYTGEVGDGKIFIYAVEGALRIRTKQSGVTALS
jgi:nitrogen regulatory protein P-II 1